MAMTLNRGRLDASIGRWVTVRSYLDRYLLAICLLSIVVIAFRDDLSNLKRYAACGVGIFSFLLAFDRRFVAYSVLSIILARSLFGFAVWRRFEFLLIALAIGALTLFVGRSGTKSFWRPENTSIQTGLWYSNNNSRFLQMALDVLIVGSMLLLVGELN